MKAFLGDGMDPEVEWNLMTVKCAWNCEGLTDDDGNSKPAAFAILARGSYTSMWDGNPQDAVCFCQSHCDTEWNEETCGVDQGYRDMGDWKDPNAAWNPFITGAQKCVGGGVSRWSVIELFGFSGRSAPSCTQPASSITGDPHVQNMKGRKMDIFKSGWLSMVQVSLGSNIYLQMQGRIARGDQYHWCGETFLKEIEITTWNDQKIVLMGQHDLKLLINGQLVLNSTNCGLNKCDVTYNGTKFQLQTGISKHRNSGNSRMTMLSFNLPTGDTVDAFIEHVDTHFNLEVRGLQLLGDRMQIGGILGNSEDGFSEWIVKPSSCSNLVVTESGPASGSIMKAVDALHQNNNLLMSQMSQILRESGHDMLISRVGSAGCGKCSCEGKKDCICDCPIFGSF